jgi:hypothetical protein
MVRLRLRLRSTKFQGYAGFLIKTGYFCREILQDFLMCKCKVAYKLSNIKKIHSVVPPCKKTIFNSHEEAQDMIQYIKQNRRVQELSAYKCMTCGFWHLTSKSK